MKIRIVLLVILSFAYYLGTAQVPQGFNYQAIARNPADGTPIIDKPMTVRLTIQSDSLGSVSNIIFWQEDHSVTTNSYGLINVIVGKGSKVQGTAITFSAIDWSITPKFIKTEINFGGWKTMGSSRLWTIPYSMIAGNLGGAVKKLEVLGEDVASDEALFEVKRKDGETMFAVYNYGVRVFMPLDTLSKARKGGFAVGGFSKAKGTIQNYFVVNPDSIRAYIDTNPDKARKGGFAVGGFDKAKAGNEEYLRVTRDSTRVYINDDTTKARKGGFAVGGFSKAKGANASFLDVATDATGIINPSQNRILWYPIKNAFLTGKVLIQKPDSVGVNSFATGYESKAKGQYSQALGFKAIARGDYSTAIGKNALANKINSFAFGDSARALKNESYAIGRGSIANGYRSFAIGSAGVDTSGNPTGVTRAIGDYSFAMGQGAQALGDGAFAIGIADTANGDFSVALGSFTNAIHSYSSALGYYSKTKGEFSTAVGYYCQALSPYSVALGTVCWSFNNYSMAIGDHCRSYGYGALALGSDITTIGDYSVALGVGCTTNGSQSHTFGQYCTANGVGSTAMGNYTTAFSGYETVVGSNNTNYVPLSVNWFSPTDRLFVIGNGVPYGTKSNAMTVLKNGKTAIGHDSPTQMLDVNGNARFRSVTSGTFGNNLNIMADGTLTTATSDIKMKENILQISDALDRVMKLRGVFFNWKNDSTKTKQIGMIAQEVEPIVPEIVFTNPVDGLRGINYSQSSALFVEAIKEQQKQIEFQQKEIDELQTLVNSLIAKQSKKENN